MESERDDLGRQLTAQSEAHAKVLRDLREEEKRRESELEKEKTMQQNILKTVSVCVLCAVLWCIEAQIAGLSLFGVCVCVVQSRESELESTHIHYANALAAAHRELEAHTRDAQKVLSEKRWLEAEQNSLTEQLQLLKDKAAKDAEELKRTKEQCSAQLKQMQQQLADAQHSLERVQTAHSKDRERLEELSAAGAGSGATSASASTAAGAGPGSGADSSEQALRIAELEKQYVCCCVYRFKQLFLLVCSNDCMWCGVCVRACRVRVMADSLLQKSTYADRISGERSSLKLQLEQESRRVAALEQSLRLAQVRAAALEAAEEAGTASASAAGGSASSTDLEAGDAVKRRPIGGLAAAAAVWTRM